MGCQGCQLARATVFEDCACVHFVKMASRVGNPQRLLRPNWEELIERVWADRITDKLFSLEIISAIESKAARSRRKGAKLLLNIMLTRSWEQCVEFAVIVSETEGVKDLGEKLLEDAGWLHVPWHVVVTGWCDSLLCCVGCRRRGYDRWSRQKNDCS